MRDCGSIPHGDPTFGQSAEIFKLFISLFHLLNLLYTTNQIFL